jgi:N-acylneuraminate cytidylyltransferase/CMP-N,N'-diacetyllegionaminic acid synthase
MKILAVITARGGSKSIKNKNIVKFLKKPLIYWTIKEAKKSKLINKLIVSTDSVKIKNTAEKFNTEVPFLRPRSISTDQSKSSAAIIHAINFYKKKKIHFDYVMMLEPTSPLRSYFDIDKAIKLIVKNKAKSLVTFTKTKSSHPHFLYRIVKKKIFPYIYKSKYFVTRRQDLKDFYYPDGTIYISEVDYYLKKKNFYHEKTYPLILPEWKSFEIDSYNDLKIAEAVMRIKNKFY